LNISLNMSSKLHTDGYLVIDSCLEVTPKIVRFVTKRADRFARPIFNSNRNDRKRLQCTLRYGQKYMENFMRRVRKIIEANVSEELTMRDWVILKSKDGCKAQLAHTDYIMNDQLLECPDEVFPLSAIIALTDKTKINIWPKSIKKADAVPNGETISRQTLELKAGDIFIFRGDLVHAGCYYDKLNYRLHCFLDSPHFSRKHNTTFVIKDIRKWKRKLLDFKNKIEDAW